MVTFKNIIDDIYLLETPFGSIWSGVVLIRGKQNILIDSGASDETVDECLIPALEKEGLDLDDISLLLNTHCHGDHIGGHYRIRELCDIKTATYKGSIDKIQHPLKYSKLIRARYPQYSPSPPPVLRGVQPDFLIEDNELVAGRLRLVHTPGHDDDTVCWFDEETKTLLTGDSLQAGGAPNLGIGFYQDLTAYRDSLLRISEMQIENIIAAHYLVPCGSTAIGKDAVQEYLSVCKNDGG